MDDRSSDSIRPLDGVPENIRSLFETARNLIVYSWFYYPFNVTAELCAYTTVEYALRLKAGDTKGRMTFSRLLEKAVAENWIRDDGFSHVIRSGRARLLPSRNVITAHEDVRPTIPPEFQQPDEPLAQEYCNALIKAMPQLRNSLAHGSNFLHESGAFTVRLCADLINQLFEPLKRRRRGGRPGH